VIFSVCIGVFLILLVIMVVAMIKHRRRIRNLPPLQPIALQLMLPVNPETLNSFNAKVFNFDIVNDECSICLENECNVLTVCGHYYHFKCIKEWTRH